VFGCIILLLYNDNITAEKDSELQESQNSEYALVLQLYVSKNLKNSSKRQFSSLLYFASFKICLGISGILKNDPQFHTKDWVNLAQVPTEFRATFHLQLMPETCDFKTQNHALIFISYCLC
jgi:hypothetical protein